MSNSFMDWILNINLLDDHPHFLRYATDLAKVLRNTIFVDQAWFCASAVSTKL